MPRVCRKRNGRHRRACRRRGGLPFGANTGSENCVFVDLHIVVAPDTSIERGHEIAHAVETALRARYSQIVDVVAHVEPAE